MRTPTFPSGLDIIANLLQNPQRLSQFNYAVIPDGRSIALVPTGQRQPVIHTVVRVLPDASTSSTFPQQSAQESQTHVHMPTDRAVTVTSAHVTANGGVAYLTAWENGSQAELVIVEQVALQRMLDHSSPSSLVRISEGKGDNLTLWRDLLPSTNSSQVIAPGVVVHRFPLTAIWP